MTTSESVRSTVERRLLGEVRAMVDYGLGAGIALPAGAVNVAREVQLLDPGALDADTVERVQAAHAALARAVAPASPRSLDLLDNEARRDRHVDWLPSLGPVPLVRQLAVVGLLFLLGFVLLGMSSAVSEESGGILDSSGGDLLVNLLFVLCASGLGAVFAALFKVNQFIGKRTYDPIYESSYWVNIVLGLIGGLLLSELLLEVIQDSDTEPSGAPFARPLLALVGGFSAKVVFQVLNRLVEAVGSIFKGDTDELVASRLEAAQARLVLQQTDERVKLSTKLVQLQQSLNAGVAPAELASSVNAILDEVLPYSAVPPSPSAATSGPPPAAPSAEASGPATDPATDAATGPAGTDAVTGPPPDAPAADAGTDAPTGPPPDAPAADAATDAAADATGPATDPAADAPTGPVGTSDPTTDASTDEAAGATTEPSGGGGSPPGDAPSVDAAPPAPDAVPGRA